MYYDDTDNLLLGSVIMLGERLYWSSERILAACGCTTSTLVSLDRQVAALGAVYLLHPFRLLFKSQVPCGSTKAESVYLIYGRVFQTAEFMRFYVIIGLQVIITLLTVGPMPGLNCMHCQIGRSSFNNQLSTTSC